MVEMAAVRLVPLAPFPAVGPAAGAIRMKPSPYTFGAFEVVALGHVHPRIDAPRHARRVHTPADQSSIEDRRGRGRLTVHVLALQMRRVLTRGELAETAETPCV